MVDVYRPIDKEGFGMSIIKKVEVLAFCRLAMEFPFRVCVAVGIVLLAVSCTTTKVYLPALDASITTEAETLVVYTDTDYVRGFVAPGKVIRGAGKGAMQGLRHRPTTARRRADWSSWLAAARHRRHRRTSESRRRPA